MRLCESFILRRVTGDGTLYFNGGGTTKDITKARLYTKAIVRNGFETIAADKALADLIENHNLCAFLLRRISEGDTEALGQAEEASDQAAFLLYHAGNRDKWKSKNWDKRTDKPIMTPG